MHRDAAGGAPQDACARRQHEAQRALPVAEAGRESACRSAYRRHRPAATSEIVEHGLAAAQLLAVGAVVPGQRAGARLVARLVASQPADRGADGPPRGRGDGERGGADEHDDQRGRDQNADALLAGNDASGDGQDPDNDAT